MEGSHWFRLGAIVALFIGSLYVLLPTILQVDPPAEDQEDVIPGSARIGSSVERLLFRLDVESGDPEALASAVEARFDAAGVPHDGVTVDLERTVPQVVVRRDKTVADETMLEALAPSPSVVLHPLTVELPEMAPSSASALTEMPSVSALNGQTPTGAPLDLRATRVAGSVITLDRVPDTDPGPMTLSVDDAIVGVVMLDIPETDETDPAVLTDKARWAPLGGYTGLRGALKVTPLPGTLKAVDAGDDTATDVTPAEVAEVASVYPQWLLDILPDTRMPLGLDLQGGTDLTLQVLLEEALLSQSNRDLVYLDERATEKGLTITDVRRNRYEPIMEVASPDGADALQGFIGESMGTQYEYLDSVADGETTYHRFIMSSVRQDELRKQSVNQVLDVLRKRVAETKVRDPVVVQKGGGKISVQLPGLADSETAVAAISKSAILEFRLVDPEFRRDEVSRLLEIAEEKMLPQYYGDDQHLNEWLHDEGLLPKDRLVLFEYKVDLDPTSGERRKRRSFAYALNRSVVLTGQDVNSAEVNFDPKTQRPAVSMEFKPAGSTVFCDFTGEHVDDQFAIILDREVQSAPNINERICGGRAQITMGDSINAQDEAKALAVVLRTGSLNAPVNIGSVREIGPSLGRDAIQAGSIATVGGGSIVLLFMLIWYKFPGFIADIALVLNILLMLAGLSLFGWTLTLPGIAGIALTIGMAVDANIIIYERIREELKMGQHARKAVETGFKKAAVAVLDANITTAIAGVVLFSYGNVTIQGFAVTLLMGIGTTLLTALFVTRSLLEIATRRTTSRLRI